MTLGLSFDMYSFTAQWGGFKSAVAYYGPNAVFDAGSKNREGRLDGGTVSLGWGNGWSVDFAARQGSSSIDLPSTYTLASGASTLTIRFLDRVSFTDKQYDIRLRKIILNRNQWVGYAALGYFNQETNQKYRTNIGSATFALGATRQDVTSVLSSGVQKLDALSGDTGQSYANLGVGIGRQFELAPTWFLAVKAEGAFLAGNAKGTNVFQAVSVDATTGLVAGRGGATKNTVYGGKGLGTVRLSHPISPQVVVALDGGLEYWTFVKSANTSSYTSGILGRAYIQYRF